MALFQQSVLKKYLADIDQSKLETAWKQFQLHFHNAVIQQNITNNKEEAYQEGFVRDFFVQVLGYTLKPQPDFNIELEKKTAADSTKSDGAFLKNGEVIGVLELKDTNTTDLEKVEKQVFGYKHKHKHCVYVITSNFRKLRFYISDAIEHLEFDLFTIDRQEFSLLYCCLHVSALMADTPLKMKQASLAQEETITKKLYADYSHFKKQLFSNIVALNPEQNKLELFKKTQKLLDRFLFILFAEDRGLLPPNLILKILAEYETAKRLRLGQPLYNRFKLYFNDLHEGNSAEDIFAYNGGLFAPDALLDNLNISDDLLYESCKGLSNYDFESEVDVNILGHIFEHSLSQIEELQAELEGHAVDKTNTKRKKDGVFYTPRYITKYIVENTVGTLCVQQKEKLQIVDEAFTADKRKQNKEQLLKQLEDYRNWLLQLTICDPACGSGAFLNQALEFLIGEHHYIDELKARLFGDAMILSDVETSILENNLYGVDINEEAVEIAKLSLWLRTAHKGRKLNNLSSHIQCGNSLIDDPAVAGDKAFNWQKAFPKVFIPKQKEAFHLTFVTHYSRRSERMDRYRVPHKEGFWMNEEAEVLIAGYIADVVKQQGYHVLAFNICGDHVHMLVVAEEAEVPEIMRKIKGKASQRFKEHLGIEKEEEFHLWAQKYSCTWIDGEDHLNNAITYNANNRQKHELRDNKGLQPIAENARPLAEDEHPHNKGLQPLAAIAARMCTTYEQAFATEYKGGFDVVIGNPPYGIIIDTNEIKYYKNYFPLTTYKTNLYVLFLEKMLKSFHGSLVSFIIPKSLLFNSFYSPIREYLLLHTCIHELFTISEKVFEDAEVGGSLMIFFTPFSSRHVHKGNPIRLISAKSFIDFPSSAVIASSTQEYFLETTNKEISITLDSLSDLKYRLNKLPPIQTFYNLKNGLNPGNVKHILIGQKKETANHKAIIWGKDLSRYSIDWSGEFINYDESLKNEITIEQTKSKEGMKAQGKIDFALRTPDIFETNKILVRKTGDSLIAALDTDSYYFDTLVHGIYEKNENYSLKYLLAILNSKPATAFYRLLHEIKGKVFAKISLDNLSQFPIPLTVQSSKLKLEELTDVLTDLKNTLHILSKNYQKLVKAKLPEFSFAKRTGNWYTMEISNFLKELEKQKIKLTLAEQSEWLQYFEEQKAKATAIQQQIDATDAEIDRKVYALYGLTEEEIKVVEGK